MRLQKLTKLAVLLISVLLLSSCASKGLTLYPIQPTDFYVQDNGDICMTEFYFNEVLQLKLKEMK
jgi:hypothetical protein